MGFQMIVKPLGLSLKVDHGTNLKPLLSALSCDSSCEPATQVPDDEVEKLMESKPPTVGGPSVGVNIISIENEPGKSEKTLIEDFSSIPLEELQDSFGIYKDTLPKYRVLSAFSIGRFWHRLKDIWTEWIHEQN